MILPDWREGKNESKERDLWHPLLNGAFKQPDLLWNNLEISLKWFLFKKTEQRISFVTEMQAFFPQQINMNSPMGDQNNKIIQLLKWIFFHFCLNVIHTDSPSLNATELAMIWHIIGLINNVLISFLEKQNIWETQRRILLQNFETVTANLKPKAKINPINPGTTTFVIARTWIDATSLMNIGVKTQQLWNETLLLLDWNKVFSTLTTEEKFHLSFQLTHTLVNAFFIEIPKGKTLQWTTTETSIKQQPQIIDSTSHQEQLLRLIFLENSDTVKKCITIENYGELIPAINSLTETMKSPIFRSTLAEIFFKIYKEKTKDDCDLSLAWFEKGIDTIYKQQNQLILLHIWELEKMNTKAQEVTTVNMDRIVSDADLQEFFWNYQYQLIPWHGLITQTNNFPTSQKNVPNFPLSIEEFCKFLDEISKVPLSGFHNGLNIGPHDFHDFTAAIRDYLSKNHNLPDDWEIDVLLDYHTIQGMGGYLLGSLCNMIARTPLVYEKFAKSFPTNTIPCINELIKKFSIDLRRQFNDPDLLKEDFIQALKFLEELFESYKDSCVLDKTPVDSLRFWLYGRVDAEWRTLSSIFTQDDVEKIWFEVDKILRTNEYSNLSQLLKKHYPTIDWIWILPLLKDIGTNLEKYKQAREIITARRKDKK